MQRSPITTHVLDTATGLPAAGIAVSLERRVGMDWQIIAKSRTDADGRIQTWMNEKLETDIYRLNFALDEYFASQNRASFYPEAQITFRVEDRNQHYHVPLLLSPFGFSTYRGS